MNEVSWLFQPFLIGGAIITLVNSSILTVHLWHYHRERAAESQRLDALRSDTESSAVRRFGEVWSGINELRSAVSDLKSLADGVYARRDDVKDEVRKLSEDIRERQQQTITLLARLTGAGK